jgi:predicted heme/steroid binding protein
MGRVKKLTVFLAGVVLLSLFPVGGAEARPEFARLTGNPCSACHVSPQGGGPLKPEGVEFKKKLNSLDIQIDQKLRISTGQRLLHLALYLVHIPFGVAWAGLFLYTFAPSLRTPRVIIPSGPYARQILYGMIVVLITGPLMVAVKMKMTPGLFATAFGILLLVKIAAAVALTAATAALLWHTRVVLAKRYRRLAKSLDAGNTLELTPGDLLLFDGSDKRKALFAMAGRVYDVTGRSLWRRGIHPGGHHAGRDLTDDITKAPHGKDVFERISPAGRMITPESPGSGGPFSWAVRLGFAASGVILLVVVLWRW